MPMDLSMLMQNPQMLQALGMGGGGAGGAGGVPGAPFPGLNSSIMSQLAGRLGGGGPPPNPPPTGMGGPTGTMGDAAPIMPSGGPPPNPPATGGPRSNPGLMPSSSPQTAPQAGTYESGPRMAGDSQNTPTNREPTGENPQRPQAQNAIPNIPRNRFGALLMPPGGQVGGGSAAAPNPAGSFNWQNILNSFLQKRGMGGQPGAMGAPGPGGPTGGMGMGTGSAPGAPMPY